MRKTFALVLLAIFALSETALAQQEPDHTEAIVDAEATVDTEVAVGEETTVDTVIVEESVSDKAARK